MKEVKSGKLQNQYELLISLFDSRDKNHFYGETLNSFVNGQRNSIMENSKADFLDSLLRMQFLHWLPDLMLTKLDKITMAHSLESRVPFLDHKLVEFLFKTPPHLKLKGLKDKLILRNYLTQLLPKENSQRQKKPFYMPVKQFLNTNPLKGFVDLIFSEEVVRRRGYFDWEKVRWLRQNMGKDFVYDKQIFSLVSLELWHRIFIDQESGWVEKGFKKGENGLGNSVVYV